MFGDSRLENFLVVSILISKFLSSDCGGAGTLGPACVQRLLHGVEHEVGLHELLTRAVERSR